MLKLKKVFFLILVFVFVANFLFLPKGFAKDIKMGYVDLRKAFYEYEKTKKLEKELNDISLEKQNKRDEQIKVLNNLRGEVEILQGEAKSKKQAELDKSLAELQKFDQEARKEIIDKKNNMFKIVIDDIKKIVEQIGEKEGYEYIFDSKDMMYANKKTDLTDIVIKKLNKK